MQKAGWKKIEAQILHFYVDAVMENIRSAMLLIYRSLWQMSGKRSSKHDGCVGWTSKNIGGGRLNSKIDL